MASIALHATQLVLQGTLGAAAAQVGLHFYIKDSTTPEQKLNAWAFTLIAVCAVSAALGVSTSALLVGVALHTLMLLKTSASFFLPQELIKVKNFPHPLPFITEKTPTGVLGINYLNVRGMYPERCKPQYATPCISTYVPFGEEKIRIDFKINSDETLSPLKSCGLKLSFTFDKTTGKTKIVASEDKLIHLAIQARNAANGEPLMTHLINQKQPLLQNTACFKLCEENLYVHEALEDAWMSSPTWAQVEHLPTGQSSYFKPLELCHVPNGNWGFLYFFPKKETLFKVACYKFQGKLYLQDVWGVWQCAGDAQKSDLSKEESEQLTLSLGLSARCLLEKPDSTVKKDKPLGTIIRSPIEEYRLAVDSPEGTRILLDPSREALLIYTHTDVFGKSIDVKLIANDGSLIVDPDDYDRLCRFVKAEMGREVTP